MSKVKLTVIFSSMYFLFMCNYVCSWVADDPVRLTHPAYNVGNQMYGVSNSFNSDYTKILFSEGYYFGTTDHPYWGSDASYVTPRGYCYGTIASMKALTSTYGDPDTWTLNDGSLAAYLVAAPSFEAADDVNAGDCTAEGVPYGCCTGVDTCSACNNYSDTTRIGKPFWSETDPDIIWILNDNWSSTGALYIGKYDTSDDCFDADFIQVCSSCSAYNAGCVGSDNPWDCCTGSGTGSCSQDEEITGFMVGGTYDGYLMVSLNQFDGWSNALQDGGFLIDVDDVEEDGDETVAKICVCESGSSCNTWSGSCSGDVKYDGSDRFVIRDEDGSCCPDECLEAYQCNDYTNDFPNYSHGHGGMSGSRNYTVGHCQGTGSDELSIYEIDETDGCDPVIIDCDTEGYCEVGDEASGCGACGHFSWEPTSDTTFIGEGCIDYDVYNGYPDLGGHQMMIFTFDDITPSISSQRILNWETPNRWYKNYYGTVTSNSATDLYDTTLNQFNWYMENYTTVAYNLTDGSSGTVDDYVSSSRLTVDISGGSDNTWQIGDSYRIKMQVLNYHVHFIPYFLKNGSTIAFSGTGDGNQSQDDYYWYGKDQSPAWSADGSGDNGEPWQNVGLWIMDIENIGNSYYVDADASDDSGEGTQENPLKYHPWMSSSTSGIVLYPGDTVYMQRGDTWAKSSPIEPWITVANSGNSINGYITTTAYGTGALPIIKISTATDEHVIYANSKSYIKFDSLHIQHASTFYYDNDRDGIHVEDDDAGNYPHHWTITNCEIDTVPGAGIRFYSDAHDITIGNESATSTATISSYSNYIHDFGYAGVVLHGRESGSNSNFKVYYNYIDDGAGTGTGNCGSYTQYGILFSSVSTSTDFPKYAYANYNYISNIDFLEAIHSTGGSYIYIQNNKIVDCLEGIHFEAESGIGALTPICDYVYIDDNIIERADDSYCIATGRRFITLSGESSVKLTDGYVRRNQCYFTDNPTTNIASHGVQVQYTDGSNIFVEDNEFYNGCTANLSAAIYLHRFDGVTVRRNTVHEWPQTYGIRIDTSNEEAGNNYLEIYNNRFKRINIPIFFDNGTIDKRVNIYNNTVIASSGDYTSYPIYAEQSTGSQGSIYLTNNIIMHENSSSSRLLYIIGSASGTLSAEHNAWYNSTHATPWYHNSTGYSWSTWNSAGYDSPVGWNQDPGLVDVSNDNVNLKYDSVLIDSAYDLGDTYAYAMDPRDTSHVFNSIYQDWYGSGWDVGSTIYTGALSGIVRDPNGNAITGKTVYVYAYELEGSGNTTHLTNQAYVGSTASDSSTGVWMMENIVEDEYQVVFQFYGTYGSRTNIAGAEIMQSIDIGYTP